MVALSVQFQDGLILRQRIAGLDQYPQDVACSDVFAQLGECEVDHDQEPLSRRTQRIRGYETAGFAFSGLMLCVLIACCTTDRSIVPSRASVASVATTT